MITKLKRTKQCKKCPWRTDVDPLDIPDGYSPERHENLSCTIADPNQLQQTKAMACHESPVGDEAHCIGWLMNQLGPGNNIALRMQVRNCTNIGKVKTIGEQHKTFEDTLPILRN